jgi:TolB-like protein/tetratricopeptide (TPR) repeat protein/DNA-binding winged helix-turn-helix (wHTH) protein
MAAEICNRYVLGEFELDAAQQVLKHHSEHNHLPNLPFQVLLFLINNRDRYVSRRELLEHFWSGSASYEETLTKCISTIRTHLNDPPLAPRFIETRKKVGYRYIGPCELTVSPAFAASGDTLEVETTRVISVVIDEQNDIPKGALDSGNPEALIVQPLVGRPLLSTSSNVITRKTIVATIVVSILVGTGLFLSRQRPVAAVPPDKIGSIAVLPFSNVSGDETSVYIGERMTESLVSELSRIDGLRVVSTSAFSRFKGEQVDPREVGRRLSVSAVLEGSVHKNGDQVHVTMRLSSAEDGRVLWVSDAHDRRIQDILGLQDEITHDVVGRLGLKLNEKNVPQTAGNSIRNGNAYRAYLLGRFWVDKRSVEGGLKGIEYFNQAIKYDPDYALAYIGLADCYGQLHDLNYLPPQEAIAKEKDLVIKALAIDDNLAEAHTEMGLILAWLDWDFELADREYRRGIELNPNSPRGHHWYRGYLTIMGRYSEALAEERRALELDPTSVRYAASVGWVLYYARRYDEALVELHKALEMDRTFEPALEWLGLTYLKLEKYQQAIDIFEQALRLHPNAITLKAHLGQAYALSGRDADARRLLKELEHLSASRYINPYDMAIIYTGLGDKDRAFANLDKAFVAHSSQMPKLKVEPQLDTLRSDPRFQDLVSRVGMTP